MLSLFISTSMLNPGGWVFDTLLDCRDAVLGLVHRFASFALFFSNSGKLWSSLAQAGHCYFTVVATVKWISVKSARNIGVNVRKDEHCSSECGGSQSVTLCCHSRVFALQKGRDRGRRPGRGQFGLSQSSYISSRLAFRRDFKHAR